MEKLLEDTRRMNRMIQRSDSYPISFEEMASILCELIGANTYLVDTGGRVLGVELTAGFECEILVDHVINKRQFPTDYNQKLLQLPETAANITQEQRQCVFSTDDRCMYEAKMTTIVPVYGGGERLGTIVLARYGGKFEDSDLILAEHAATVVGIEMMRELGAKREEEARSRAAVQVALSTLSFSELEAIRHIFEELASEEGLLVASSVADRVGITRSVIVNALRKFESAGVIETRSLGMKGTHIRVLNKRLIPELERWRK